MENEFYRVECLRIATQIAASDQVLETARALWAFVSGIDDNTPAPSIMEAAE